MEPHEKKLCKICYQEIDTRAKRCPYCRHWQKKLSILLYHPATAVALVGIPLLVMYYYMGTMYQDMFSKGEDFTLHAEELSVEQSQMSFGESECGPTVMVVGTISNTGNIIWEDVNLEVTYHDESGQLIDAEQERMYSFIIPANDKTAFKVSSRKEFDESKYASYSIRIITAKEDKGRF